VAGKLTCFDRLIFKGHLANFNMPGRMKAFLDHQGVLLKSFDRYVSTATTKVRDHAKRLASSAGRPYLIWPRPTPRAEASRRRSWPGRSPPAMGSSPG